MFSCALSAGLILQALFASPVLAIQTHGAPEGLYAHQTGHILYGLAMVGFALRIHLSPLAQQRSWRLMTRGAVLLACWNGWAFIAHILDRTVLSEHFLHNAQNVKIALNMQTLVDWLYYLFKMDHLICVPALIFIYLALHDMNNTFENFKDRQ